MKSTIYKYLSLMFLKKFFYVTLVFICLIFILSLLEEINFFKNNNNNLITPLLSTALNTPSVLFEIFPFIILISTQFLFLNLIENKELNALKINGISNIKIILCLLLNTFVIGIILILFYYQFSSKLKFIYLDMKNSYSNDNKYLAVVTNNGLWIKDEIDDKILSVNSTEIKNKFPIKNSIPEFDKNFRLNRVIESDKIDIGKKKWVILNPVVSNNNQTAKIDGNITINTHFDYFKINSLYRDLSSLNFFEINKLKEEFIFLGYSTKEIDSKLNSLYSYPIYLTLMTLITSILMFRIQVNKPLIFHLIISILLSVLIYYLTYLFRILGENEKLPLEVSSWLPLVVLFLFSSLGIVRINEK